MLRYSPGFVGEGSLEEPNNWPKPAEPTPEISWYRSIFFPSGKLKVAFTVKTIKKNKNTNQRTKSTVVFFFSLI